MIDASDPFQYDIFSGSPESGSLWIERVQGRDAAVERMQVIAAETPGRFFVFGGRERQVVANADTRTPKTNEKQSMKGGAIIALVLGVLLAAWAFGDYSRNETLLRDHSDLASGAIHRMDEAQYREASRDEDSDVAAEYRDGAAGVASIAALIGSVVMFSKAKKEKLERLSRAPKS